MASVRQTDCKTGWQIIVNGRVYLTVRREAAAREIAAEIDGGAGQDQA